MSDIYVPDLVINNVVRVESGSILDIDDESLKEQMNVNLYEYIRIAEALIPPHDRSRQLGQSYSVFAQWHHPPPMVSRNITSCCLGKAANNSLS